jgi:hypothetical protein
MSSPAQQLANQQNAQHSTGPKTDIGKAISSLNAVATALTGRTVLLPADDRDRYAAHLAEYRALYRPANLIETNLVQAIADTDWRLNRIPHLILGLEARAAAETYAEHAASAGTETAITEAHGVNFSLEGYLRYERQIRNLYIQEGRLHRRRAKDLAELQAMQIRRQHERSSQLRTAVTHYRDAIRAGKPYEPAAAIGFEFSTTELQLEAERLGFLPPSSNRDQMNENSRLRR